jgi:hypothetical protein
MRLSELREEVLSVLPLGEKAIYGKYLDLDNKYQVWRTVLAGRY